jgi:hypothetical protein
VYFWITGLSPAEASSPNWRLKAICCSGVRMLVAHDQQPVGIDPGLVQLAEEIVADRLARSRR